LPTNDSWWRTRTPERCCASRRDREAVARLKPDDWSGFKLKPSPSFSQFTSAVALVVNRVVRDRVRDGVTDLETEFTLLAHQRQLVELSSSSKIKINF